MVHHRPLLSKNAKGWLYFGGALVLSIVVVIILLLVFLFGLVKLGTSGM